MRTTEAILSSLTLPSRDAYDLPASHKRFADGGQYRIEIRSMLALGREHGIEVCLFVGPRANWDVGVQAASASGEVIGAVASPLSVRV